jgi:hypothetical protein
MLSSKWGTPKRDTIHARPHSNRRVGEFDTLHIADQSDKFGLEHRFLVKYTYCEASY